MLHLLQEAFKKKILVPKDPQIVGALGAALLAGDCYYHGYLPEKA
jgi:activator of 2-hydroxyglutaryl-CoA dehydratase